MRGRVRVFLVDDHPLVRHGVRDVFSTRDDVAVVGDASSAEDALTMIGQTEPDVAVIDVRLGKGSDRGGIELCRAIRSIYPEIACVMLTSVANDEVVLESILAGAAAYVLKEARTEELLSTILRVAGGEHLLVPAMTEQIVDRLSKPPPDTGVLESFTPRERRILDLIGDGMTDREIARTTFLAVGTVRDHVSNLVAKLGLSCRAEAAAYAHQLH